MLKNTPLPKIVLACRIAFAVFIRQTCVRRFNALNHRSRPYDYLPPDTNPPTLSS